MKKSFLKTFSVNFLGSTYCLSLSTRPFNIRFDKVNWKRINKIKHDIEFGHIEKTLVQHRLCESADKLLEKCLQQAPDDYNKDKLIENYKKFYNKINEEV